MTLSISLILGNKVGRSDDTPIILDENNNKTLGVSTSTNEALQTNRTQEMQLAVVDIPVMAAENYSKIDVSCSGNETGRIVKTLELSGATSVDMPMMEAMYDNRMCVPSSINGAEKSGEKQDIQGTIVGIEMMEAENYIKPSVVKIIKRQAKKKKGPI